mmetsp:Transcript_12434/g.38328  ORF Transcript_12434/g.38328 Transcript_12434/m.38328 type:complete len:247 (-) Transcript_12434:570-1310(-)
MATGFWSLTTHDLSDATSASSDLARFSSASFSPIKRVLSLSSWSTRSRRRLRLATAWSRFRSRRAAFFASASSMGAPSTLLSELASETTAGDGGAAAATAAGVSADAPSEGVPSPARTSSAEMEGEGCRQCAALRPSRAAAAAGRAAGSSVSAGRAASDKGVGAPASSRRPRPSAESASSNASTSGRSASRKLAYSSSASSRGRPGVLSTKNVLYTANQWRENASDPHDTSRARPPRLQTSAAQPS